MQRSRHKAESQLLLILALLCAAVAIISFSGFVDLVTHFRHLQSLIQHSGPLGWTLYVALFIVATLCLIGRYPVMVGGVVFGPVWGTLLSLCAATLASALSFLLARWLGRDLLLTYAGHTATFQAIERGIARGGTDFLIFTRLVPLFPYNIQNYAYGLTAIPFGSFMLISVLTTLPGLFIYTLMASELARGHYVGIYTETERPASPYLASFKGPKPLPGGGRSIPTRCRLAMKKNNARLIWYGRAALVIIAVAALVAWWRIPAVNAFIQHSGGFSA